MESVQDKFKGFGAGFEGFPKRLPEDCVEYSLFIIDAKLKTNRERLARLETVRKAASKLTGTLLKEYIWQRDSFRWEIESKDGHMYLHGLTNYGDSVEDEWLIVYILREISTGFPDLWIKVVDTDGEFLLIEAANALPRWLNPEIADNRVWINNNQLKIIPLTTMPTTPSSKHTTLASSLNLDAALQIITKNPETVFNSPMIEEEAFYRLRNYPSQISNSLHHTLAIIPRKLAYILHRLPASIAPAVEAFYLRDPIALKPLQNSSSVSVFPPEDLVHVSIKFTKVLYAQLKAQQFSPPPIWRDTFTAFEENPSAAEHDQLDLGMKVTSGFEMLITDPKNKDDQRVREIHILLEDLIAEGETLPSDADIALWTDSKRTDDEKWLDINYEDFEAELDGKNRREGKGKGVPGTFGPEAPGGFGDAKTQSDLKKMVERFEAFLNDDDAGADGAEVDDMDVDDDEDDSDEETDEDEDKEVSFDEEEFARMMREMMGLPSAEEEAGTQPSSKRNENKEKGKAKESRFEVVDTDDESGEDEASEIKKLMEKMQAELDDAGALDLNPTPRKLAALDSKGAVKSRTYDREENEEDDSDDDDVNIDFNLAKNLLESFKSQGGMAGPGGNMLGMMGIKLPRDADDEKRR